MAVRSPQSGLVGAPQTLADVLAAGPLSLEVALSRAGEIAMELRDLHQRTRTYGKLTAASVLITETGARLRPLPQYPEEVPPESDVQAFGALLHQMLSGTTAATLTAGDVRIHGPRTGPGRVRPAALKLATRCQLPNNAGLSMQRVATELRLLGLLLRQHEAGLRTLQTAAPAVTPFLIRAVPPPAPPRAALPEPPFPDWTEPVEADSTVTETVPLVPLGRDSFGHPEAKPPSERQPAGGNCPRCDSSSVYVSRARSRFERMLERWSVPICRCHRCYHRYVVFARIKFPKEMPVGTRRRRRPHPRSE